MKLRGRGLSPEDFAREAKEIRQKRAAERRGAWMRWAVYEHSPQGE